MTKTLEQVIERLRQISEDRQDAISRLLLHEIDDDERWMRSMHIHSDKLETVADKILEADRRGDCEPLDPDQL